MAKLINNPVVFNHQGQLAYVFATEEGKFKGYGAKKEDNEYSPFLIEKIVNYKLYWTYLKEFNPRPIFTGLNRTIAQNLPSITLHDDNLVLNFIGQQIVKDIGVVNFLYRMEGKDIENLQPAVNTYVYSPVSCEIDNRLVFLKEHKLHIHGKEEKACIVLPFKINHISSIFGYNELVILNGSYGKNSGSFVYDLQENIVVGQIKVEGKNIKSASLYEDVLYYLEEGVVKQTTNFSIVESKVFFSDCVPSKYDERFFSYLKFQTITSQVRALEVDSDNCAYSVDISGFVNSPTGLDPDGDPAPCPDAERLNIGTVTLLHSGTNTFSGEGNNGTEDIAVELIVTESLETCTYELKIDGGSFAGCGYQWESLESEDCCSPRTLMWTSTIVGQFGVGTTVPTPTIIPSYGCCEPESCPYSHVVTLSSTCCLECDEDGCVIATCAGTVSADPTSFEESGYTCNVKLNGLDSPISVEEDESVCVTIECVPGEEVTEDEMFCYPNGCELGDCPEETPLYILSADKSALIYNAQAVFFNKKVRKGLAKLKMTD